MGDLTDKADMFRAMMRRNRSDQPDPPEPGLKQGGGDGTSGGMAPSMKDYVDARDAQNLAEMKSEFEKLRSDIARLPTTWTMVAILVSITGVVLAALAFAGARFSAGLSVADARQQQLERDAAQDKAVTGINAKLDQLLKRQPAPDQNQR